jgi:SAM-dependent methyltransferase
MNDAAMFERPAEAYDRFVGRYSRALAQRLIAAAGVRAGDRALDVGCGPGGLTGELVTLLGAGNVAAADPSTPFAEACARRTGVDVKTAAAEALPYETGAFDHVLSQLVVNFLRDAPAGLHEMVRVSRPGGVVSAAVWDYRGGMTMMRRFWDSVVALDPAGADRDEGRKMRFATPEELRELWSSRLHDVTITEAVVSAGYDGFEDLWAPFEQGIGPAGTYVAELQDRAPLKAEFRRRLDVGDAPFTLTARAWIAVGTTRPRSA